MPLCGFLVSHRLSLRPQPPLLLLPDGRPTKQPMNRAVKAVLPLPFKVSIAQETIFDNIELNFRQRGANLLYVIVRLHGKKRSSPRRTFCRIRRGTKNDRNGKEISRFGHLGPYAVMLDPRLPAVSLIVPAPAGPNPVTAGHTLPRSMSCCLWATLKAIPTQGTPFPPLRRAVSCM